MKFIDEVVIDVAAGNGGAGCASFRREKFVPLGGPDGGDGGRGGCVIAFADASLNTLVDYRYARLHEARNGEQGRGSDQFGAAGTDVILRMPVGTIVTDMQTQEVLAELMQPEQQVILARGGDGGFGNLHFKSSTNRAPRQKTPGWPGEHRKLRLELRVLADVGLLGLPNAGKSTLISVISAAKPKIADYPFTTLIPNLGVVKADDAQTFVVADIPGLIEGAHEGHGLGDQFLRHVERCSVLVHLVDLSANETPDHDAEVVARELAAYSETLAQKPRIVVGSKIDSAIEGNSEKLRAYATKNGFAYYEISAVVGDGVRELVRTLARFVREHAESREETPVG